MEAIKKITTIKNGSISFLLIALLLSLWKITV